MTLRRHGRTRLRCALSAYLLFFAVPAAAQNVVYKYDDFGRVVEATYPTGQKTVYTYDAANNRTGVVTAPASSNQAPVCTNWNITLSYPAPPYGPNTVTVSPNASAYLAHCSDSDGGTLSLITPVMPYNITINRGQTKTVTYSASDGQGGTGSAVLTIIFTP